VLIPTRVSDWVAPAETAKEAPAKIKLPDLPGIIIFKQLFESGTGPVLVVALRVAEDEVCFQSGCLLRKSFDFSTPITINAVA
jgi:hypothetical protein